MSKKVLDNERSNGGYYYSSQFLQEPYPEEGGRIKKDWFVFIDEIPKGLVWDMWVDGAYTKNKNNDPSGLMICGYDVKGKRLIVRKAKSVYYTAPEIINFIPKWFKENGHRVASMIRIEPKASGLSFIQLLRAGSNLAVSKIKGKKLIQGDKEMRLNVSAVHAESGRIHLIRDNWNDEFITQQTAFPNYSHDEYVDLLGYACDYYFKQ